MTFRVQAASLDWALKHVERFGDTDIFPTPFEFEAIRHNWDAVRDYLSRRDLDEWKTRSKRTALSPKGKYAYRVATQLDPLDTLILLGLVYEIGPDLEAFRIPAGEEIVHSHRFAARSDGELYDRASSWTSFLAKCRQLAESDDVTHVVVADISDFYHRIYHHPIENTLKAAAPGRDQVRIITDLLSQFSGGPSYGIPVGPSASRIIADVAIDDIDQHLRAEGTVFCRYSDDYRVFCKGYKDAYERLTRLAELLHHNHGLTLQQNKTFIVTTEAFSERLLSSPESEELRRLMLTFDELVQKLELDNPYEDIDYDELEPDQQEIVDRLNLEGLFAEQLKAKEVDIGLMRFILRRLGQLDDAKVALDLVENAEHFYTVVPAIVEYLGALRDMSEEDRSAVGAAIMALLDSSYVGHLPYHRSWLLSPYAANHQWGQEDKFLQIYNRYPESFTRRKMILAMGRSHQFFWFRGTRDGALDLNPWERRAFLAGTSCSPSDERRHWYNAVRSRLDVLETAVVDWARAKPF